MQRRTALSAVFLVLTSVSFAHTQTWVGNVDSEWTNPANWDPAIVPRDVSSLSIRDSQRTSINLAEPVAARYLYFNARTAYTLTGPGPLSIGAALSAGRSDDTTEQFTIDVPVVLNGSASFVSAQQNTLAFQKDIDLNAFNLTTQGNVQLNEANIVGPGEVSVQFGRLFGQGTIEANVTTLKDGIVQPEPSLRISGHAQVDAELDLLSETSFDILDGTGSGNLRINQLTIHAENNLEFSDVEFAVFPGWDSITVQQIRMPQARVKWDAERLRDGFLKLDVTPVLCDLDGSGFCDLGDLQLIGDSIYAGNYSRTNDLNQDDKVDLADRDEWISLAGIVNGRRYYVGDANFDGAVNAVDLMTIGGNWQQTVTSYYEGDFNFDGIVDAKDMNEVAKNWQKGTQARNNAVPEPANHLLLFIAFVTTLKLFRHRLLQSAIVTIVALVTLTFDQGAIAEELLCDLDGNEICDIRDIDILGNSIRNRTHELANDLNADGVVDLEDRDEWILQYSLAKGRPQFLGDANLDGVVSAADLMSLASNWQSDGLTSYAQGDFNFNGKGTVIDLNEIAKNWLAGTEPRNRAVPEPASHMLLICAAGVTMRLYQHLVPAKLLSMPQRPSKSQIEFTP